MNLTYLYDTPQVSGRLKAEIKDFIVVEDLGYNLEGTGEFVVVKINKQNCNTLYAAEKLAKYVDIHPKLVSYAGLKDKQACTEQIICLHMPGKATPDFSQFNDDKIKILSVDRHNRKIRIGSLAGNYFKILLRDVSENIDTIKRLTSLANKGFPNYYMQQRFGHNNNNFNRGIAWAKGELKPKKRADKSIYLSALRSWIFNQIVSERLTNHLADQLIENDIVKLAGSNSFFQIDLTEKANLLSRLHAADIELTAPLIGFDSFDFIKKPVNNYESKNVAEYAFLFDLFKQQNLTSARRAMIIKPQQLHWQFLHDGLSLEFWLPAGSYATALIRELIIPLEPIN